MLVSRRSWVVQFNSMKLKFNSNQINSTGVLVLSCLDVPLVQVDIGLFADQVGVTAADTLDVSQGIDNLLFTVNVGVEQTDDVLEVGLFARHES